jgi:hypothetical protein
MKYFKQCNFHSIQKIGSLIENKLANERFLAIAGIVEMPRCRMYWADETRFGPPAQKSD